MSEHKDILKLFLGIIDFHSRRKILLSVPHSSEYLQNKHIHTELLEDVYKMTV